MKQLKMGVVFLAALSTLLSLCFSAEAGRTVFPRDERTQRIVKQEAIIREGNLLVERGLYVEALVKFKEALDSSVLNTESDKGNAIYYIGKVYKLQGKYEQSLKELQWYINRKPDGPGWIDEKIEIEALIKARDLRSNQPVYDYIEYLKTKYKGSLPPKVNGYSNLLAPRIIRLYDYIGDLDQGIQFVGGFLKFYAKRGPGNPYQPANPYFQIKQAFEQDKKEGFKGCLESKPGDACMGRATKALIQSDYFAW